MLAKLDLSQTVQISSLNKKGCLQGILETKIRIITLVLYKQRLVYILVHNITHIQVAHHGINDVNVQVQVCLKSKVIKTNNSEITF